MEVEQPIIFFDGVCNLCNNAVTFIIKHDHKAHYKFASLQSDYAQKRLPKEITLSGQMQSLVLLKEGQLYVKSTAALKIAKELSGGWRFLALLLILPKFIRDPIYNLIAHNRYKWFGKRKECMLPTPELKHRFLDNQD